MRTLLTGLVAGALLVSAAACSAAPGGGAPPPAPAPAATAEPATGAVATSGPGPARPGPIRLAVTGTPLGAAVTTDGWTVYRFEADTADPPTSLCENDCLRAWPPLLTDGTPPQLDGIDPALVGTLARADGTVQVTLGGWPLYRFVDDGEPGETAGEGVGGNWSVIAADGKALVAK